MAKPKRYTPEQITRILRQQEAGIVQFGDLRVCDLVHLRVNDVTQGYNVVHRVTIMQRKTKRPVQFEISDQTRTSISNLITKCNLKPNQYLFPSRLSSSPHLSTRQYAKIVKD